MTVEQRKLVIAALRTWSRWLRRVAPVPAAAIVVIFLYAAVSGVLFQGGITGEDVFIIACFIAASLVLRLLSDAVKWCAEFLEAGS